MYLVHQGMLCKWQSYLSCCINDDLFNHCNHRYQVNGRRSEYYIYHIRFYWSINNLNYRYIGNPFLASCTDPENFSRRGWRDECVWKGVPPRFLEILLWELISLNFPGGSGPPDLPHIKFSFDYGLRVLWGCYFIYFYYIYRCWHFLIWTFKMQAFTGNLHHSWLINFLV